MQRQRSLRGGRKWSKAAVADILQIDDKPLPKLNEDEDAVVIITMEDVTEELLQVTLHSTLRSLSKHASLLSEFNF